MRSFFKRINIPSFLSFLFIFILGSLTLYSIAPSQFNLQLQAFVIGLFAMVLLSYIDYSIYLSFAKYVYIVGLLLLISTELYGQVVYGSARWLNIAGVSFQPSEIAKIAVIIGISALIAKDKTYLTSIKKLIILILLAFFYVLFIALQPDLGTSLIVLFSIAGILFAANLNKLYFIIGLSLIGIISNPLWNVLHDYQQKRILVFLNPLLDTQGEGYNVLQSKIAIGAGQLFGQGLGRGSQSHLSFLPAYWTDFIFASYAEEWGFVGVIVLFSLFFMFFISILYICSKARDSFGYLLSIGILMVFLSQFIINVGMNLGLMPVTGIPLPFVSYGGTSLVISMSMVGILQSVWVHRKTLR